MGRGSRSSVCCSALFLSFFAAVFWLCGSALGSNTNVFQVKNSLKGAILTPSGVELTTLGKRPELLLGTNANFNTLAIALQDMDCTETGVKPVIRLVAYN